MEDENGPAGGSPFTAEVFVNTFSNLQRQRVPVASRADAG
jgi:hypothetical protein